MTAFLFTLIAGLLIGFCAGAWAAPRIAIRKGEADRLRAALGALPGGEFQIKCRGTRNIGPADLPYWSGDRK